MANFFNRQFSIHENREHEDTTTEQVLENIIKNMVLVEGGDFIMGLTNKRQTDPFLMENPLFHKVSISSFRICKYTVTQNEWNRLMGNNPSEFIGSNRPVTNVSWFDCQEFIEKINKITDNRRHFRLPTEAEWEYAARGGNKSKGYIFAGSNNLEQVAWTDLNSGGKTHDVGTKQPNELGLYDMTGNIWEWCNDWYEEYDLAYKKDPQGAAGGTERIFRGGAYDNFEWDCPVGQRSFNRPLTRTNGLGFRLVVDVE